jgi:hypothetical protein
LEFEVSPFPQTGSADGVNSDGQPPGLWHNSPRSSA